MVRQAPKDTTVKMLFALSGNVCAFPGCDQPMVVNETVVGVICHIEAAEERGERYNSNQTDEERRGFENLILLCGTHHTITNDVTRYPVDTMRDMKLSHEARFREQQFDAPNSVVDQALEKFQINQANTNQGGTQYNIINQGLDPTAVTILFSALLEANFPRLMAAAQEEVRQSVAQFKQDFLRQADKSLIPADIEKLSDPDVQYVVNDAIQTVARRARPEIRDNLSFLLVERIKHNGNDRVSIVLNEAIHTSGRVTENQLKLLALWFTGYVLIREQSIETWEDLDRYFEKYVKPFLDIELNFSDIFHLMYVGCCYFRPIRPYYFVEQLKHLFLPLFVVRNPITMNDLRVANIQLEDLEEIFERLSDDHVRFKFKTLDEWDRFIETKGLTTGKLLLLRSFWEGTYASEGGEDDDELDTPAGQLVIENVGVGKEAIRAWNGSGLPKIQCVSMGVVLGAAYCSHIVTEDFDISTLI